MFHPIARDQQTLKGTELIRHPDGVLRRRARTTLDDIYRRIDENLAEL